MPILRLIGRPGREHDGVPDDSADRPALPCEMHTPGPRQTLGSGGGVWRGRSAGQGHWGTYLCTYSSAPWLLCISLQSSAMPCAPRAKDTLLQKPPPTHKASRLRSDRSVAASQVVPQGAQHEGASLSRRRGRFKGVGQGFVEISGAASFTLVGAMRPKLHHNRMGCHGAMLLTWLNKATCSCAAAGVVGYGGYERVFSAVQGGVRKRRHKVKYGSTGQGISFFSCAGKQACSPAQRVTRGAIWEIDGSHVQRACAGGLCAVESASSHPSLRLSLSPSLLPRPLPLFLPSPPPPAR